MKLQRVEIKNYRSIKQLTLYFDPRCRILVGINESGKTNILDALNLLDPNKTTTRRDLREAGRDEPQMKESHVRFIFDFAEEEMSQFAATLKGIFLARDYETPMIEVNETPMSLGVYTCSRQGIYAANILNGTKYYTVWALKNARIAAGWRKVSSVCPPDFMIKNGDSETPLAAYVLVNTNDFGDIPGEYLTDAAVNDFTDPLDQMIRGKVRDELLKVLFWNYDEKNLLPPRINLLEFCADPDSCVPLKRMFRLYGCTDVLKAVGETKEGGANALPNFLKRVAEETTRHFHETWQEYEQIKFSLGVDGPDLVAGIEDKSNHYELSQRSDGFKRFVTFLLMVSAEDATNSLQNTLLLIDEPEIGLHPTGARYLMKELINLSQNNYVVFSTHSIFMVDRHNIRRHLIVRKENEVTLVDEVSDSNIQDEEVIYNALRYSVFSNLKERNIIFEGWRDKRLFEVALSEIPGGHEELTPLKNVGVCFVEGVKQVKCVTPLFEAGDRKCLILSDDDSTAREHQQQYQKSRGFGVWKRYNEVVPDIDAKTGEDFVQTSAFEHPIADVAAKYSIASLALSELEVSRGKLDVISAWLLRSGVVRDDLGKILEGIKESLIDNLRNSELEPRYYNYLDGVLRLISGMQDEGN